MQIIDADYTLSSTARALEAQVRAARAETAAVQRELAAARKAEAAAEARYERVLWLVPVCLGLATCVLGLAIVRLEPLLKGWIMAGG